MRNRRRQPVEKESFSEKSAGTLARSLARSWPERAKIFPSARHRRCTTPGLNVASQLAKRKKRAERGERESAGCAREKGGARGLRIKRKEGNEKWPIDVKSHGEALLNVLAIFMRPTLPATP